MRIKCEVAYNGANYFGFQIQPNHDTVQQKLNVALNKIHQNRQGDCFVTGASRTDTGVHALGQVIHFDTDLEIPDENWVLALNRLLPHDIRVKSATRTSDDFHARYNSRSKIYKYYFRFGNNNYDKYIFERDYVEFVHGDLDLNLIKLMMKQLVGEHDFATFCRYDNEKSTIKDIYSVELSSDNDLYCFTFHGNGFLRYQVRTMVGTLFQIGKHKHKMSITEMISSRDRHNAGAKASARGLVLEKIFY